MQVDEDGLRELGITLRTMPGKSGDEPTQLSLNTAERGFYYYRRWVRLCARVSVLAWACVFGVHASDALSGRSIRARVACCDSS